MVLSEAFRLAPSKLFRAGYPTHGSDDLLVEDSCRIGVVHDRNYAMGTKVQLVG